MSGRVAYISTNTIRYKDEKGSMDHDNTISQKAKEFRIDLFEDKPEGNLVQLLTQESPALARLLLKGKKDKN